MSGKADKTNKSSNRIVTEIDRRRALGEPFAPLTLDDNSRNLCTSPWGQAWNRNLATYADYAEHLAPGRRLLRGSHIYDLTLTKGEIFAYVTDAEIYEVLIKIDPVPLAAWQELCAEVGGKAGNIVDVIAGHLSTDVMDVLTAPDRGLFPSPGEIHLSCDCPDWAEMCKHVAGVLYGVGTLFDRQPELFFILRDVNPADLVRTATIQAAAATEMDDHDSATILKPAELSAIFGIDLTAPEDAFPESNQHD